MTAGKTRGRHIGGGHWDYTTGEVNTGQRWTDGKPIFRKTVDVGAMPNATTKNVAHGIASLGTLVRLFGTTQGGGEFHPLPTPAHPAGAAHRIHVMLTATNIVIETGDDLSGYTIGWITVEYTKSA
jgi:hypothetical protein